MVIVYESKTGFTKRYAEMLASKTNLIAVAAKELSKISRDEEIIFLGWIKVGKIQGLGKALGYNIKAVCASGTGQTAEPDTETVISKNNIDGLPFFYLRGGCLPLNELKGIDKVMLSLFVKMLKSSNEKDEKKQEAVDIIENGFDGVKEENLLPVVAWINENKASVG